MMIKIRFRKIYLPIFLFVFIFSIKVLGQSPQEVFQKNRPAVCLVKFFRNVISHSKIGSFTKLKQKRIGVVVNPKGLVMVSSDVYPLSLDIISGGRTSFFSGEPSDFKVQLSNAKEYDADFIGKDDLAQVAFLKIRDKLPNELPYVEFTPTNHVKIGQQIYLLELLGEQQNYEPLFTPATINAVIHTPRRKFLVNTLLNALSSGGLVLAEDGKAIGVTLGASTDFQFHDQMDFDMQGGAFLEIAPTEWFGELIKDPPVLANNVFQGKSWLGIRMQALTDELESYWSIPEEGGVVVDQVYSKSPAEKGGLKVGDVILAFNDNSLNISKDEDLDQFRELITQQPPGTTVNLNIYRDGKQIPKKVELLAAPKAIDLAEKYQLASLGFEVRELTRDILYDYNLPLNTHGVYVFQVDRASPAGIAGLSIGHIITEVDNQPVKDIESFKKIMEQTLEKNPKKIMFKVQVRLVTEFVFLEVK